MEKEYNEPGEKTAATENATIVDKDMLTDDQMIDRAHASGNSGTGTKSVSEWTVPPISDAPPPADETTEQQQQPKSPIENPGLKDLPDSEKQKGAMMAAGVLVDSWEGIWQSAANLVLLFNERKLNRLHAAGEIDLNMPVVTPGGVQTTAGALFDLHNETTKDCIQPDPEFKELIQPMIAEELAKRNVGLTNMQMILVLAGKDAKTKVEAIIPSYHMKKDMLDTFREATKYYKATGQALHHATAKPNYTTPPPPPVPEAGADNNQPEPPPLYPETPVVNMVQPEFVTHVYGPQNTHTAFEEIQGARGGNAGNIVPPQAVPNLSGQATYRPKRKYVKRKKPGTKKNKGTNVQ